MIAIDCALTNVTNNIPTIMTNAISTNVTSTVSMNTDDKTDIKWIFIFCIHFY